MISWTPEKLRRVAHLLAAGNTRHATWQILVADWSDLTPDALSNAIKEIRRNNPEWLIGPLVDDDDTNAPPIAKPFKGAFELEGDWLVAGDFHAPFTDWQLLSEALNEARSMGIEQAIIGGDLFDQDQFKVHEAIVPHIPLDTEIDAAEYAVDLMLRTLKRVKFISGNHDWRVLKLMKGALSMGRASATFLAWLRGDRGGALEWSMYGYCNVQSGANRWRISHPGNYSRVPGRVAMQLAAKHKVHTCTFHEHSRGAWQCSEDEGGYWGVALGCVADPAKLGYVQMVDRTSPPMRQGYGILKDGMLYSYGYSNGRKVCG